MIEPDHQLTMLPGRPPLDTRGLWRVKLCAALLRPIVILWLPLRQKSMDARVNSKLDEVANCRHRAELEELLGKPVYAVSGEVCDTPDRPDVIECYESEGCCIDLWFKNDRLQNTSGFVKPTLWDVALTKDSV